MPGMKRVGILIVAVLVLYEAAVLITHPWTGRSAQPYRGEAYARESGELESRPASAANADRAPVTGPLSTRQAPGWMGEVPFDASADDWEPTVAADPNSPFVYRLTTRYGTPPCAGCPNPQIVFQASSDGGASWDPARPVSAPEGVAGQYDPQIGVGADGIVHAVWSDGGVIVHSSSADHGETWSEPVDIMGWLQFGDKPWLAVSPDGSDLYVAFHGPANAVAASHDGGSTWSSPVVMAPEGEVVFASGGAVGPSGSVSFVGTSLEGSMDEGVRLYGSDAIRIVVYTSNDRGSTFTSQVLDSGAVPIVCGMERTCEPEHFDSQVSIAADASGDLAVVYNLASTPKGPLPVYLRTSSSAGWSRRTRLSPPRTAAGEPVISSAPAVTGAGRGEFHLMFQDDRTGRWNTWYRATSNGGKDWTAPVRLSDARAGARYKRAAGYTAAYGDYGGIAVNARGQVVVVWGEGVSERGPGGSWSNLQT